MVAPHPPTAEGSDLVRVAMQFQKARGAAARASPPASCSLICAMVFVLSLQKLKSALGMDRVEIEAQKNQREVCYLCKECLEMS